MKGFIGKFLLLILAVVVVLQFIPVPRTNPPVNADKDFLKVLHPDKDVENLIRASCYDCHSNETVWPWYSYVAPVSWVVSNHVMVARAEFNFSEWTDYDEEKTDEFLEDCVEALRDGKMPEQSYLSKHEEARLTKAQRALLIEFFEGMGE